jgi:hypothetical protein
MSETELAASLTEAQRRAVCASTFQDADGAWHPEGWYCHADKRVRYNLCRAGITRDYLRRSNRLTPLGLAVRAILKEQAR